MKKKIEIVILLAVILGLGAYLLLKRTDRVHYEVPELHKVDTAAITSIEISSAGQGVLLTRKGKDWTVGPEGFPADSRKVEKMLRSISALTLTDLVSDSKNYGRYELGDKEKVTVKASEGTRVIRQVDIGKAAPSGRHAFVMVPGDGNVYQAVEVYREDFQGNEASFRDRRVLSFPVDDIARVSIVTGRTTAVLTKQEPKDKPGTPASWVDKAGREAPKDEVDLLLSSLSSLECSEFLDDLKKESLVSPEVTITLTGSSEHTFSLYSKREGRTPAVSSGSPYVFTLQDYRLEAIRKAANQMMGKK